MFQSCGLPDAIFSKNLTSTYCGEPIRDRGLEFKLTNYLLGSLATVIVLARLGYKRFLSANRTLGADDWTILAAGFIGLASIVLQVFFLTPSGLGQDIWKLDIPQLVLFGKYFYAMEMLYLTLITLIKISLCLFYLAIFPARDVRRLLWITIAFNAAFGLAFLVKTSFQCTPVSFNWTRYNGDPTTTGHCININASGWANGVLGVVADIWLFALPLAQVKKLRLHWKKKVGAFIMFLTGGIVTIISMLRLKSVLHFANSHNPTWNHWGIVFWSTIEVSVGFICCCLPTLRLILIKAYPRVSDTKSSRSRSRTAKTSCTASSNRYRRNSMSHMTVEYDDLSDPDSDDRGSSRADLAAAHRSHVRKGAGGDDDDDDDDLEGGTTKVRIQSLQSMPSQKECIELVTKDPGPKEGADKE